MTKESISRERVEQVWRGEWKEGGFVRLLPSDSQRRYFRCSECGHITRVYDLNFCQSCGTAMTDEAVDMVMERMEAIE